MGHRFKSVDPAYILPSQYVLLQKRSHEERPLQTPIGEVGRCRVDIPVVFAESSLTTKIRLMFAAFSGAGVRGAGCYQRHHIRKREEGVSQLERAKPFASSASRNLLFHLHRAMAEHGVSRRRSQIVRKSPAPNLFLIF